MVRHLILWKLKDELSPEEKERRKQDIKTGLEGLNGQIPGLLSIKVRTEYLPSTTVDLMLDSLFESEAALKGYSVHPAHVHVADSFVRPFTAHRACIDYEVTEDA